MFKRLILPILILAVAIPVMAQRPGERIRQKRVQRAIQLTPDQRSTLKSMVEANKAQRQAIMQEVLQKAQVLRALRSQQNPNPTELGNAMLALKDVRERAQQLRQQTMNNFKNT